MGGRVQANKPMQKKLLLALVGALLAGAVSSSAQTPPPAVAVPVAPAAPSSSWLIQPAVASTYMFRGARLGGAGFEPTIEYDAGPLAAGVWANFPFKDKVPGQSDPEFDFYGSYTIDA